MGESVRIQRCWLRVERNRPLPSPIEWPPEDHWSTVRLPFGAVRIVRPSQPTDRTDAGPHLTHCTRSAIIGSSKRTLVRGIQGPNRADVSENATQQITEKTSRGQAAH